MSCVRLCTLCNRALRMALKEFLQAEEAQEEQLQANRQAIRQLGN